MEYIKEFKVTILKETYKSTFEEELKLNEYDSDETVEKFVARVHKRLKEYE